MNRDATLALPSPGLLCSRPCRPPAHIPPARPDRCPPSMARRERGQDGAPSAAHTPSFLPCSWWGPEALPPHFQPGARWMQEHCPGGLLGASGLTCAEVGLDGKLT